VDSSCRYKAARTTGVALCAMQCSHLQGDLSRGRSSQCTYTSLANEIIIMIIIINVCYFEIPRDHMLQRVKNNNNNTGKMKDGEKNDLVIMPACAEMKLINDVKRMFTSFGLSLLCHKVLCKIM